MREEFESANAKIPDVNAQKVTVVTQPAALAAPLPSGTMSDNFEQEHVRGPLPSEHRDWKLTLAGVAGNILEWYDNETQQTSDFIV